MVGFDPVASPDDDTVPLISDNSLTGKARAVFQTMRTSYRSDVPDHVTQAVTCSFVNFVASLVSR